MKYVDRGNDRLTVRIDRLVEKNRLLTQEVRELRGLLHAVMDNALIDD